jgi:hypothetical protein
MMLVFKCLIGTNLQRLPQFDRTGAVKRNVNFVNFTPNRPITFKKA